MSVAVFDLETTGIPSQRGRGYYPSSETTAYDSARVIEMAVVVYNREGRTMRHYSTLVKPDNWVIENTFIHGITDEEAEEKGVSIAEALDGFLQCLGNVRVLVAHNIKFDKNILLSECHRLDHPLKQVICECGIADTMLMGEHVYKLSKWPRLSALYEMVTQESADQKHRAMGDVQLCARCYFGIRDLQ